MSPRFWRGRNTGYDSIVISVNKILSEYDFSLTLRQIYYRLVAAGKIPNKRSAYNQLSKTLVKARENGEVDDTRIEDRARQVLPFSEASGFRTLYVVAEPFGSPKDYIRTAKALLMKFGEAYRMDLWQDQEAYVEVWVEKDALSQVIAQVATPLRTVVCPSRGYSSYTYIKRMAVEDRFARVSKPIKILDFRDHDPSGIQMTEDLQTRFSKYGGDHEIEVTRIALTIDQVRKHDLIPNPTKMADPRSPAYVAQFGNECWELDAIEPRELQAIVSEAIEEHIDQDLWNEAKKQEDQDRDSLIQAFRNARVTVPWGQP